MCGDMKPVVLIGIETDLYAIETYAVDRVIPLVDLRPVPHVPQFVRGLLNLGGRTVPVVDLGSLLLYRPCRDMLGTRIVVVNYPCHDGVERLLGLVAEKVLDVRRVDPGDFQNSVRTNGAPFLGPVFQVEEGTVQMIELARLLPEPLQDGLFALKEDSG